MLKEEILYYIDALPEEKLKDIHQYVKGMYNCSSPKNQVILQNLTKDEKDAVVESRKDYEKGNHVNMANCIDMWKK